MKKRVSIVLATLVIVALVFPSLSFADAPVRFENELHFDYPVFACDAGHTVWNELIGGNSGYIHYDQDGLVTRTFKHWQWDIRWYSPETGKEFWGTCNILNFYDGPEATTGMRATGVIWHVTAPHFGIIYIGTGQLVFSTPNPDATAILKEVGLSPFYGAQNQLCDALAP